MESSQPYKGPIDSIIDSLDKSNNRDLLELSKNLKKARKQVRINRER